MELKKYKLSDLCIPNKIGIYGIPASAEDFSEDKIRYLRISDISDDGILLDNDKKSVTDKDIEKYILEENDIVFARTGNSTGRAYLYDSNDGILAFAGFLIKYQLDNTKVNPRFVRYFTISEYYKQWVKNLSVGSTRGNISAQTFADCPIILPPRQQQDGLAFILHLIDRKIALNRAINRNLEALAKQLYDYWFVQFDFPDENGRPYKSSGGKMVWNEVLKREIPEGWEVKRLGDVIRKLSSGKRPKGGIDKALKDGIPSLGAECIDDMGVFDYGSTPNLPFSYRDSITSGIIENKDILVYKDGAYVGKTTLFQDGFPFKFACVNEHVFLIHAQDEDLQEYLLFTLKNPTYYEMMQKFGKAKAAQPGLNQDDICSIPFLAPETVILKKFRERVEAPFHLIFSQSLEIATLTRQRDEILPLLMNGQVTIE